MEEVEREKGTVVVGFDGESEEANADVNVTIGTSLLIVCFVSFCALSVITLWNSVIDLAVNYELLTSGAANSYKLFWRTQAQYGFVASIVAIVSGGYLQYILSGWTSLSKINEFFQKLFQKLKTA